MASTGDTIMGAFVNDSFGVFEVFEEVCRDVGLVVVRGEDITGGVGVGGDDGVGDNGLFWSWSSSPACWVFGFGVINGVITP